MSLTSARCVPIWRTTSCRPCTGKTAPFVNGTRSGRACSRPRIQSACWRAIATASSSGARAGTMAMMPSPSALSRMDMRRARGCRRTSSVVSVVPSRMARRFDAVLALFDRCGPAVKAPLPARNRVCPERPPAPWRPSRTAGPAAGAGCASEPAGIAGNDLLQRRRERIRRERIADRGEPGLRSLRGVLVAVAPCHVDLSGKRSGDVRDGGDAADAAGTQ